MSLVFSHKYNFPTPPSTPASTDYIIDIVEGQYEAANYADDIIEMAEGNNIDFEEDLEYFLNDDNNQNLHNFELDSLTTTAESELGSTAEPENLENLDYTLPTIIMSYVRNIR
ncbi:unnamed protein product [Gordionus sp. m RMFG-2023]